MLPHLNVKPRPNRPYLRSAPIGVDGNNYFVRRGVTAFWLFGYGPPLNVIGPYPFIQTTGNPAHYSGPRGPEYFGINSPNNNYWTVRTGAILGGKANFSIVAGARQNGNSGGNAAMIYSERAASGNDIINLGLAGSTSNRRFSFTYRNDGGTLVNPTNGLVMNANQYYVLGGSKSTSAITQYVNGLQDVTNAWSSNDNFTDANIIVNIGNTQQNLGSSGWGAHIQFVCLFAWALSATDHLMFAVDPYQFLVLREDLIASLIGPAAPAGTGSGMTAVSIITS